MKQLTTTLNNLTTFTALLLSAEYGLIKRHYESYLHQQVWPTDFRYRRQHAVL